jgi:hypothetical protein
MPPVLFGKSIVRTGRTWHGIGLYWGVRSVRGTVLVFLVMFTALVAVGLAAPADGPFSISVRPIFLRIDPSSTGQPRPRALGLDVDVKCGSMHVHMGWPGFLLAEISTLPPDQRL